MSEPMLRASDADQIVWEAMRELQIAIIAAAADKDTPSTSREADRYLNAKGHHLIGEATRVHLWAFPDKDADVPDVVVDKNAAQVEVEVSSEPSLFGLITLRDVCDIVRDAIIKAAEQTMEKLIEAAIEKVNSKTPGGYLTTAATSKIPNLAQNVAWSALNKLINQVMPNRARRIGVQRISTRSVSVPEYGWFQFSGKRAFKFRTGRPALSEREWLRRYWARRRARNKTRRTRRSTGPKLPETKHPRPARDYIPSPPTGTAPTFGAKPTPQEIAQSIGEWEIKRALDRKFEQELARIPGRKIPR